MQGFNLYIIVCTYLTSVWLFFPTQAAEDLTFQVFLGLLNYVFMTPRLGFFFFFLHIIQQQAENMLLNITFSSQMKLFGIFMCE